MNFRWAAAPMGGVLAVVLAVALWPSAQTTVSPRPIPNEEEESVPHLDAPEGSGWARLAGAAVGALSRRPSHSDIRHRLSSDSFELKPSEVDEAIALLAENLDEESMFKLARELQRLLTPDRIPAAMAILREAPQRAVGLHALLGRREVQGEVSDLFLRDPEVAVRATAAFLLQEIPDGLPEGIWEEARRNIREAPDSLKVESMELLAARPLSDSDARVIATGARDASAEVRIAAARALAAGKADASLLRPVLESIAWDDSLPEEARRAAAEALRDSRP